MNALPGEPFSMHLDGKSIDTIDEVQKIVSQQTGKEDWLLLCQENQIGEICLKPIIPNVPSTPG